MDRKAPIDQKLSKYVQNTLWARVGIVNYILLPFSLLYSLFYNIRYYFFQTPFVSRIHVICVGNAIAGGAGKTPIVIRLIQLLSQITRVATITKGYLGAISSNSSVVKVDLNKHSHIDVGDEALLLAQHGDIFVSKNRRLSIIAAEEYGAKIVIMDDGLQDNSIHKDFTIFALNSVAPNRLIMPAGPLRESVEQCVDKADIVAIPDGYFYSGSDKIKVFKYRQIIANESEISGKNFVLLCGIANPERVVATALAIGAKINKSYLYADHHKFSTQELQQIYADAKSLKCKVLTTTKDSTRLPSKYKRQTVVMMHSIAFIDESMLMEILCRIIL